MIEERDLNDLNEKVFTNLEIYRTVILHKLSFFLFNKYEKHKTSKRWTIYLIQTIHIFVHTNRYFKLNIK